MNVDWKDVGIRSLKTFLEVLLGYVATYFSGAVDLGNGDRAAIIGVLVCGISTAATAVLNGVIIPLFKPKEKLEDEL